MSKYLFADVFVIAECRRMARRYLGMYPPEVNEWLSTMTKEQAVMHRDVYDLLAGGVDEQKIKGKYWEFEEEWQQQRGEVSSDPGLSYRNEVEDEWRRDRRAK